MAKCDHPRTLVIDSRKEYGFIRRRRDCHDCGLRYTTYELAIDRSTALASYMLFRLPQDAKDSIKRIITTVAGN